MIAKFVYEAFNKKGDPIKDMGIGLEAIRWNDLKNLNAIDFAHYIDNNFPEIKQKYRVDENTLAFDEYYVDIPFFELEKHGIRSYMIEKIEQNSVSFSSWIDFDGNFLSIGG